MCSNMTIEFCKHTPSGFYMWRLKVYATFQQIANLFVRSLCTGACVASFFCAAGMVLAPAGAKRWHWEFFWGGRSASLPARRTARGPYYLTEIYVKCWELNLESFDLHPREVVATLRARASCPHETFGITARYPCKRGAARASGGLVPGSALACTIS